MTANVLLAIFRDFLLSRTILAALVADCLLLLPFFFTSNLFSKILPSGNTSSLVILLVFSLLAQHLSKTYDRLRTAGLLKIQRRVLRTLEPQEGVLLFARGRDLTPNVKLLQSIFVLMRSGEFIVVGGAALQVFFPIAVLILIVFASVKLFFVVLIFLLLYGLIFQGMNLPKNQAHKEQEDRMKKIRNSWFYRWMGAAVRRDLFFVQAARKSGKSPWSAAISAANLASFRYSSSLVLLSLCAFFIITEGLPTGYLLPISFFSQRLLMPAERIRQVSLIYRIFTFAAMNDGKTTLLPADSAGLAVDGLKFSTPLKVSKDKTKILLADAFEVKAGQLLVITGGTGLGKSSILEAILGIQSIEEGRIDLVSRNKAPWGQIRYLNQHHLLGEKVEMSFYLSRLMDVEQVLTNPEGQLIVLDDPLMGMDGLARNRVVELIQQAKRAGAVLVVSTNDRQIVSIAERWLSIQENGEMQLRQLGATA